MSYNAKVKLARKAGRVNRYHQRQMIHGEDVAQHSFNMMNTLMILTDGNASKHLLVAALLHDQGEYVTGDIPAPVKHSLLSIDQNFLLKKMEEQGVNVIHNAGMPTLTNWEQILLKVADNLDGLWKCWEELEKGNDDLKEVGIAYAGFLEAQLDSLKGGTLCDFVRGEVKNFRNYVGE